VEKAPGRLGRERIRRLRTRLRLLAGHRVRIQTRATLVRRDFDLLRKYKDQVQLGTSLPHLDDDLAKVLEPKAPPAVSQD
jgi:DNA repair photolyase